MKVFCYFHNDDLDGWGSSAVIKKAYPNAEFCGYNYEDEIKLVSGYDIVFMVDCSVPTEKMKFLMDNNKDFIWIDHHAKKIWQILETLNPKGLRDTENNHSACVLAWMYLYPKEEIPEVLLYIEDLDLWKFNLPNSKKINMTLNIEYKGWRESIKELFYKGEWKFKEQELRIHGELYIRMENNQIEYLLKTIHIIDFHGYKTGVVNSPVHTSFIGHQILDKNPDIQIALIWYCNGDTVYCSLRSRCDINVADIAEQYGGGGHKPASGFRVKKDIIKHILEKD